MNASARSTRFPLLLLAIGTLFSSPAYAAGKVAPKYIPSTLGVIDNAGSSTVVRRVNSQNQVVGAYRGGKAKQVLSAFLLSSTLFDSFLDWYGADSSTSYGVNDSGETVGAINGPTSMLPFRSVGRTLFLPLPLLPGDSSGAAYGINDQGETVGFSSGPNGVRAMWWTRIGFPTRLPGLASGAAVKAVAINNKGDVAGNAGDGDTAAVRWTAKGSPIPLDTLAGFNSSRAESINAGGDIAGSATEVAAFGSHMHAVLWPSGSTNAVDLGVLPGGGSSRARDVDDSGWVVGTGDSAEGNRAFLWSADTGMIDLNTLSTDPALILVDALSINKKGVILAIGISTADAPPMHAMGTMVATSHVEERELPRHIVLLTPVK